MASQRRSLPRNKIGGINARYAKKEGCKMRNRNREPVRTKKKAGNGISSCPPLMYSRDCIETKVRLFSAPPYYLGLVHFLTPTSFLTAGQGQYTRDNTYR